MMRPGGWRVPPWGATTYLLGTLATAVVSVLALPLLCHPTLRRPWAQWHRDRAARVARATAEAYPVPARRYVRWLLAHGATGVPIGVVVVLCVANALLAAVVTVLWWVFPAGDPARLLLDVPVTSWGAALVLGPSQIAILGALTYVLFPPLASVHARISMAMLAPSAAERLAARVEVLTRTRADALEAHAAELRRIERDLHDGTQARLVAIAMRLAVARDALPDDPRFASDILQQAHEVAEEAMTELREVIRGIYPPILADRGLAGALRTVAARAGVPTEVEIDDVGRVPAAVEAVAYFAVAEALTNVAKHSGATRASVSVHRNGDRLSLTIRDDGVGGADEERGTGLAGVRRRAEAFDGTASVTSPVGGPTTIELEMPCGS
jgi:signal transduction histidine kinase